MNPKDFLGKNVQNLEADQGPSPADFETEHLIDISIPTLEAFLEKLTNPASEISTNMAQEKDGDSLQTEDPLTSSPCIFPALTDSPTVPTNLENEKQSAVTVTEDVSIEETEPVTVRDSLDPTFEPSHEEENSSDEDNIQDNTSQLKRKRRKTRTPEEWLQNIPKSKRLKGLPHVTRRGKMREERSLGPECESSYCVKSKYRNCSKISEAQRQEIFSNFWSLESWEERKRIVKCLIDVSDKKQIKEIRSARGRPISYFLKDADGGKQQVCKSMFASTLGIPVRTLGFWLSDREEIDRCNEKNTDQPTEEDNVVQEKCTYPGKKLFDVEVNFLKTWLNDLPVVYSHYCRKTEAYKNKKILEPGTKVIDLHNVYVKDAQSKDVRAAGYTYFKNMFIDLNFSVFRPRKDQCDECVSFKQGHIDQQTHEKHLAAKDQARLEKSEDKKRAEEDDSVSVWTMDAQAVLLCPSTKASALYYRCKLQVHNFTLYNLHTKAGYCYVWDESNGGLKSEVFTHLIYKHFKTYIDTNPEIKELILWSDGAMYQNKNVVLSNALLQLSMETGVIILQKYLVVGHTQMECDSMHSTIERNIRGDIYTPRDYIKIMETARRNPEYIVHQMEFSEFKKMTKTRLNSIRPGKKVGDPTVNQLSHLKYFPQGDIGYKLFNVENSEWADIPARITPLNVSEIQWNQLYDQRLPLTRRKYDDLQYMKKVLSAEAGIFYDSLPHE